MSSPENSAERIGWLDAPDPPPGPPPGPSPDPPPDPEECPWRSPTCRSPEGDHLACLRTLHEERHSWLDICRAGREEGLLETLHGFPIVCKVASAKGLLECLRYAHENGCPWNESTCHSASEHGHLACLRYAHENGCPWGEYTCQFASEHGNLDCLRYAHQNGAPWDPMTCSMASFNGRLDCLRYAHQNGCPWDEWTCRWSAIHGHLDCLRYAHENGCPWDEGTTVSAMYTGNVECLHYALENGCTMPDLTVGEGEVIFVAYPYFSHLHIRGAIPLSVVAYLYHRGTPLPNAIDHHIRAHVRAHVAGARTLLRCAVRLVGSYGRACARVYSPDGVGYREAETSFHHTAGKIDPDDLLSLSMGSLDVRIHHHNTSPHRDDNLKEFLDTIQ